MNPVMIYICLIKELTLTVGKTGLVGFIFNKEMGCCYAEPLLFTLSIICFTFSCLVFTSIQACSLSC